MSKFTVTQLDKDQRISIDGCYNTMIILWLQLLSVGDGMR
jgi:hypothetical protein